MSERFSFFFQAEDGIRDVAVTGVQTVLFRSSAAIGWMLTIAVSRARRGDDGDRPAACRRRGGILQRRSEERRVGKECRSRWTACGARKKKAKTSRNRKSNRSCTMTRLEKRTV